MIPPMRGRPSEKLPRTKWRKRMATDFDKKKNGQRWQIKTVNSMIKRMLGSAWRSRGARTQNQEIEFRAITHKGMILTRRASTWHQSRGEPFLTYRKFLMP